MWGTTTKKKEALPFYQKRLKEDRDRPRLLLGCGFLGLLLKSQFFVCVYIFRERKLLREKKIVGFFVYGERDWGDSAGEGVFFGICGEEARFYRCFRNARLIFLRFALPSFSTEPKQIEFLPFYFLGSLQCQSNCYESYLDSKFCRFFFYFSNFFYFSFHLFFFFLVFCFGKGVILFPKFGCLIRSSCLVDTQIFD